MRTALVLLLVLTSPLAAHAAEPIHLTFLALNDFHGALDGVELDERGSTVSLGGAEWVSGYVQAIRRENPKGTVLLDAGDLFQGGLASNLSEGSAVIAFYNALGVAASTLGNHEFDYGPVGPGATATKPGEDPLGTLKARIAQAKFPFVNGNVFRKGTEERWQERNLKPFHVLKVAGLKVGVLGVTTPTTPTVTMPANVAGLEFRDPVPALKPLLAELKKAKVDLVVVLAHVDGSCARGGGRKGGCQLEGELGALVEGLADSGVAVVHAGHTHTNVHTIDLGIAVTEGYAKGTALSRVDLWVDPVTRRVIPERTAVSAPISVCRAVVPSSRVCGPRSPSAALLAKVTPDAKMTKLLAAYRKKAEETCGSPITTAPKRLSKEGEPVSPLGWTLVSLLRAAYPTADVSLMNSGGVRADLPEGPLTQCDIQAALPFDNAPVEVELTGAELALLLRLTTSGAHGIPLVDGLTYRYDRCRAPNPADDLDGDGKVAKWEVDRLVWVRMPDGQPPVPDRSYRVVMPSFLADGGDDLSILMGKVPKERFHAHTDTVLWKAVSKVLKERTGPLVAPTGAPPYESEGSCR